MSQKLPVNGFKCRNDKSKFNEKSTKSYDKDNDKGCILEVDVKYSKILHDLHSNFFFFPESINVKKWNKLACNLLNRGKCVLHKKSVKQALYHELTLKKVYRTIKFNQEA